MLKKIIFTGFLIFMISTTALAQLGQPEHVSQLFSMACVFNKTLADKGEVNVYIYKSDGVYNVLKSFEGQKMGNVTIKNISSGSSMPSNQPDMLYIGNADKASELINYCNDNSVLCMTNDAEIVNAGASIGVSLIGGKATILLNPKGVAAQNQSFNPAIMKIAKVAN